VLCSDSCGLWSVDGHTAYLLAYAVEQGQPPGAPLWQPLQAQEFITRLAEEILSIQRVNAYLTALLLKCAKRSNACFDISSGTM
jgi:hypothetical protein